MAPALLCAILAGWGVYVLTADERPTYRSQALLNTGIMTGRDGSGTYVRDLVLNELENIMNLARSFETREELSAVLFAKLLALDRGDSHIISPRAYDDFFAEVDSSLVLRYKAMRSEERIYEAIVADRDSLKRFGEATAEHPLMELLYGTDPLVGMEALASLRVNRKGMSDLLELSYSTVDAAWCKLTLDEHIEVFLAQHKLVEDQRSGGALSYFKEATANSRTKLDQVENRLRDFSTDNKIINYYEQTRFIASLKNQVDSRYIEERMKQAAADSTLQTLEGKLAKRMDLVRLNNVVDDRRRELGQLSREQVRLEIMSADSSETAESDLEGIKAQMDGIRKELSQDISSLQGVYNGPEGLELGRLISEWLVASIQVEEAKGKIEVLNSRKVDFGSLYTNMASLGSTMKKIEREVHIAEEDYLENLRNLNEALQKEHSQRSITDLRLVDQPSLPNKPEKSKRLIMVIVAFIVGGAFPIILAIALELLSGAILSFAEGERRSELLVVGGVARWSTVRRILRRKAESALRATTADLLWQGLRSRGNAGDMTERPHIIALASFRPGAGKSYVANLLAKRLADRGMQICVVKDKRTSAKPVSGVTWVAIDSVAAMSPGANARELAGFTEENWALLDVVIWELPAMATGRLPVDIARNSHDALLIHPASAGWTGAHDGGLAQLKDTLGRSPQMVLNGISADVLLNEWGSTWSQIKSWSKDEELADIEAELSSKAPAPIIATPALMPIELPPVLEEEPAVAPVSQVVTAVVRKQEEVVVETPIVSQRKPLFSLPEQPTTPAPFPHVQAEKEEQQEAVPTEVEIQEAAQAAKFWEDSLKEVAGTSAPLGLPTPITPVPDQSDWEQNLLS
ncbi:MAG: hypothetical protein AB8F78_14320 [Saprospiraceae bacterium]